MYCEEEESKREEEDKGKWNKERKAEVAVHRKIPRELFRLVLKGL